MKSLFYLIICCIFNSFNSFNALRWTKYNSPYITMETVISLKYVKLMPEIDVSSGGQITIIKDSQHYDKGIVLYCMISGYEKDDIIKYSFCKDNECTNLENQKQYNFDIEFNTNIPNYKGFKAWIKFSSSTYDFSGRYYCKATKLKLEIRSKNVEIRDEFFWSKHLFSNVVNTMKRDIKIISLSSLPQVLNCSDGITQLNSEAPQWIKAEFISPIFWSVCPVKRPEDAKTVTDQMNLNRCLQFSKDKCDNTIKSSICPRSLSDMPQWSTFVNQRGDLIFTGLTPKEDSDVGSYSFLCYSKNKYNTFITHSYFYDEGNSQNAVSKGITIDTKTPALLEVLRMVSPPVQEFIIYARETFKELVLNYNNHVTIYAFYKCSSDAAYKWKFNGVPLNKNALIDIGKYTVTFKGDITSDLAGKYTLEVMDKSDKITMEVNVKVMGLPILVNDDCLVPLRYVKANESITMSCKYKQRPTDIKLQINGQEIKLGETLHNSKSNLKISNPYLDMLSFEVSPKKFVEADTVTISYSVFNLTKSLGQTQYQDHTVTFIATNDFGLSVKTSSIYVVPDLKTIVDYYPQQDSCINLCKSSKLNKFNCKVRVEEYDKKELTVEYYWTINSNKLGDPTPDPRNIFAPYFEVDHKTKELTMLPIKSNNTAKDNMVKKALFDNYIECNINIHASNKEESKFFYTSNSDRTLGNTMKAKIRLDFVPTDYAFVYWIIITILLVLVVIIVIFTYFRRSKGEVYLLDKLERQHGYNPENEVKNLIFKPYEREDSEHTFQKLPSETALYDDNTVNSEETVT